MISPFRALPRAAQVAVTALCTFCSSAMAQPASFFDIGSVSAPSAPPTAREYAQLSWSNLLDPFNQDTLTVKWMRFDVQTPINSPLYLDIDTRLYQLDNLPTGLTLALYDNAGNLVAVDDRDGSFPEGFGAAALSFGSTAFRVPPDYIFCIGQDGSLPAGRYWLALVAGSLDRATIGPTGWNVTTTAQYPIGFFDPGTYFVEISMILGNTTPVPPPVNDLCQNAIVLSESPDPETPAWTGTNAGAFNDGQFPCWSFPPPLDVKDVWFRYIPSRSGYAEIIATGGAGGATPILSRYDAALGCGSPSLECIGGGSIVFDDDGTRILVPVTQGEPVLFALGIRAGGVYDMELTINLLPPPCNLVIPPDAVQESETACGQDLNGGCNVNPPVFEPLAVGQTSFGTLFTSRPTRDTDWKQFTLTGRARVRISYASQMPVLVAGGLRDTEPGQCIQGFSFQFVDRGYSGLCQARVQEADLEPGEYGMVIVPARFEPLNCGSGYEQYWIRVDATPLPPSCPADITGIGGPPSEPDGLVTGDDFNAFISAFAAGDLLADITGIGGPPSEPDDLITGDDFNAFIAAFAAGCP
jgi:hypothetical protein